MTYHEAEQRIMRDASILRASEEAFEKGMPCKYTEEQVLEAQKKTGYMYIKNIKEKTVIPKTVCIISVLNMTYTLFYWPIIFFDNSYASAVSTVLYIIAGFFCCRLVSKFEKNIQKDDYCFENWMKKISEFERNSFIFNVIFLVLNNLASYRFSWLYDIGLWIIYLFLVLMIVKLAYSYFVKAFFQYHRKRRIYGDSIPTDLS